MLNLKLEKQLILFLMIILMNKTYQENAIKIKRRPIDFNVSSLLSTRMPSSLWKKLFFGG